MIQFMLPLIQAWLPIWEHYLVYFLALVVVGFVPVFIYSFFRS